MSSREELWLGKPYYSLDAYCKNTFRHKCYKIALDAHMTCPNRDGTLDTRGCIFCSRGGSGDFAVPVGRPNLSPVDDQIGKNAATAAGDPTSLSSLDDQIKAGLSLFRGKRVGNHFIAYFQAYTNTYASVEYLETIYTQALDHPDICGISIATRPDCLPEEVMSLLSRLKRKYLEKFIWIELGLQTMHDRSAAYIRRGYDLPCLTDALSRLKKADIPVILHIILGLPGETAEDMYQTIRFVNGCRPFGVKLQLLHVLKDTDLAEEYEKGTFQVLTMDAYLDILIRCLELLSPEIVVHRVTGDGPKGLTLAPLWSLDKRNVLNTLHSRMKALDAWQGKEYRHV